MAHQVETLVAVGISGTAYGQGASSGDRIITSVQTPTSAEPLDTTAFGDSHRRKEAGLTDGSITLGYKLETDLGAAVTINGLLGTVVAVTVKHDGGSAISASNPEEQFNVLVSEGIPLGGDVGGLIEGTVTWPMDTVVTYDVTP